MGIRRTTLILVAGCTAFGGVQAARADCAGPELSFRPDRIDAGDTLTVEGRFWDDICDDVGGGSCFGGDDGFDSHPTQDIEISLKPARGEDGREPIFLGEVDADENARFRLEVELPDDLEPGVRYRVIANGTRSGDVLIVDSNSGSR